MAAANAFFPRQTHSSGRVLDSADFLTENKMVTFYQPIESHYA